MYWDLENKSVFYIQCFTFLFLAYRERENAFLKYIQFYSNSKQLAIKKAFSPLNHLPIQKNKK